MSFDAPGRNLESNEQLPSLHKASPDEVKKVGEQIEHSNHLRKVNDVLNKFNFSNEQEEEGFRSILNKYDKNTLENLSLKSEDEIKAFIMGKKIEDNSLEAKEEVEKSARIDSKLSKIKQTLTPEILSNHPKIEERFEALNLAKTPKEKEAILQDVLNILKEPGVLQSIIKELGGADKNNPKYQEFKNTLIGIDSSFENIFKDIETINIEEALNNGEIIQGLEKGGIVNIDLKSSTSKLSLIGSDYSFDEKINKQELNELMGDNTNKIESVQNSFAVLKGSYEPFNSLLIHIRENWGKDDFKSKINTAISNFPIDTFSNLNEIYEDIEIPNNIQLKESDISSLRDIKSPNELREKIENIKTKFQKIVEAIQKKQAGIIKEHKTEMKTLLERKAEAKEKQLEVLKFFKASGFDLIPKEITNKLISELQSNTLRVPGLELNIANIDLKNGHFGESEAFVDQDSGINAMAKRNIVMFMNKMISGSIGEPLDVDTIANGIGVVNPAKLKNDFIEAGIMGGVGWKYSQIIKNLKTQ